MCVNLLFQRFGHAPNIIIIILLSYTVAFGIHRCLFNFFFQFCFRSFPSVMFLACENAISICSQFTDMSSGFSVVSVRCFAWINRYAAHSNRPQHSTLANGIFLYFLGYFFSSTFQHASLLEHQNCHLCSFVFMKIHLKMD